MFTIIETQKDTHYASHYMGQVVTMIYILLFEMLKSKTKTSKTYGSTCFYFM